MTHEQEDRFAVDEPVTFLTNTSGASALTIANGTNGQIKILVATNIIGGSMTFTSQSNVQLPQMVVLYLHLTILEILQL